MVPQEAADNLLSEDDSRPCFNPSLAICPVLCLFTVPGLSHGREEVFKNGYQPFAAGAGMRNAPGMPVSSVASFAP